MLHFTENEASRRVGFCQLQEPSIYKPKISAGVFLPPVLVLEICFIFSRTIWQEYGHRYEF